MGLCVERFSDRNRAGRRARWYDLGAPDADGDDRRKRCDHSTSDQRSRCWTTSIWCVDLLTPGERVNVNPQLIFNTLTVARNITSDNIPVIRELASFLYRFEASGQAAV